MPKFTPDISPFFADFGETVVITRDGALIAQTVGIHDHPDLFGRVGTLPVAQHAHQLLCQAAAVEDVCKDDTVIIGESTHFVLDRHDDGIGCTTLFLALAP